MSRRLQPRPEVGGMAGEAPTDPSVVGRRIFAAIVDLGLWFVLFIIVPLHFGRHSAGNGQVGVALVDSPFVAFVVAWWCYFTVSEWLFGQTVGKLLLGVKVVSKIGKPLTLPQSTVRNVFRFIDGFPYFLPYLLGLLVLSLNQRRLRLGDMVAGTTIVNTPHH
jgi:uncharacterized RDD family membrane protein YckC